ncbi:hypothetical protein C7293_22555 [filamentous cyanobacterium CCT1]|nr:hypothetical protein C7293_22555 [filamentous cyanobacterium CCT1]PSN76654.1 hypothetical protein C8B47_26145 [filamentous cyanobacterium CCP4]
MAESGRIVRSYCGFLPRLEGRSRHIIRCEHLDFIPGEGFSPFRAEPCFTHQIWIWYRLNRNPDRLNLLFRGQFDFSCPEQDAHELARRVTDYLANLLINNGEHENQLFLSETSWKFWALAIDKYISTEKSLLCLLNMTENYSVPTEEVYLQFKALKAQTKNLSSDLVKTLFSNVLMARKISQKEQSLLIGLLSEPGMDVEHLGIINRLFEGIKKGSIRVI